jgi:molybdopterin-guanine dinucleotide biosynthesis protein A
VSRAGYLLAGGRSTRMGRDKALLPLRGASLGESVARIVEAAAGNVSVVGRAELASFRSIPDRFPGEGPLGGILTALADSTADWNLIVACDMPAVTVEFLVTLLEAAERRDADALLPTGPSGRPEPLCAVYHRRSIERLEAAFSGGVRKVREAAAGLAMIVLPVEEVAYFQNVNTPEDWSGYAAN